MERSVFKMWGHEESAVAVEDIEGIENSPVRLPAMGQRALQSRGIWHGGLFVATLSDGSTLPFVVGNAVDFPNWPPGIDLSNVVDVQPHAGRDIFRDRAPSTYERSAPYEWCVYDA